MELNGTDVEASYAARISESYNSCPVELGHKLWWTWRELSPQSPQCECGALPLCLWPRLTLETILPEEVGCKNSKTWIMGAEVVFDAVLVPVLTRNGVTKGNVTLPVLDIFCDTSLTC